MTTTKKKQPKDNVEELKQLLLKAKITKPRFKLPWDLENAEAALTAAYMAEVEYRHRSFVSDQATTDHIFKMADWLTSPDPKFGMLLCGQCGNGKTTLMLALRSLIGYLNKSVRYDNQVHLSIITANMICHNAKHSPVVYDKLVKLPMLAIDDLGNEPAEILDYGNVLNPVIDLLASRYNDQLFTIVTTNLDPKEIREHYGDRIADRFNEMFDRIIFNNPTYRI